jgi:hypothetical protein
VQPLSELTPSDSERLITVSGNRDKVLRAVALILNTVSAKRQPLSIPEPPAGSRLGAAAACHMRASPGLACHLPSARTPATLKCHTPVD